MNDTEQIKRAVEPLTRRGDLGALKSSGFYTNPIPCPFHGGKNHNAYLHKDGGIKCFSKCAGHFYTTPEVMDVFNIQRDPNWKARLSPTERAKIDRRQLRRRDKEEREAVYASAQQARWELSYVARQIEQHGYLPDAWRKACLTYLPASVTAIIEGIVHYRFRNRSFPDSEQDLADELATAGRWAGGNSLPFVLDSKGYKSSTFRRAFSEHQDVLPALSPKCSIYGVAYTEPNGEKPYQRAVKDNLAYMDWIKRLRNGLVKRAFMRSIERNEGLADSRLTRRALVEHFGEFDYSHDLGDKKATVKANKVASRLRESLGVQSTDDSEWTLTLDWTLAKPNEYRALIMRADWDRHGVERSKEAWANRLGCERHTVNKICERAGLELIRRAPIEVGVSTKREVWAAQKRHSGSAIVQVKRGYDRMPFSAAMDIQRGDSVVLARVSEHHVVADGAPSEREVLAENERELQFPKPAPRRPQPESDTVRIADSNMREPRDGEWRLGRWNPKWVYWQMIRYLIAVHDWRVDKERRLLIHKLTGAVYENPDTETLRQIVAAGCQPFIREATDAELALAAAVSDPLVAMAVNDLGGTIKGG